jgi:hypothetical protein
MKEKKRNSKLQYSKTQILMEGRIGNSKFKTSRMQSGAQAHVCACFILMEVMPLQDSC